MFLRSPWPCRVLSATTSSLHERMLSWLTDPFHNVSSRLHSLVTRQLVYGVLLGFSLSVTSTSLALYFQQRRQARIQDRFEPRPIELRSDEIIDGLTGLIGEVCQCTPLFFAHP